MGTIRLVMDGLNGGLDGDGRWGFIHSKLLKWL
jgi:hypothetical protein